MVCILLKFVFLSSLEIIFEVLECSETVEVFLIFTFTDKFIFEYLLPRGFDCLEEAFISFKYLVFILCKFFSSVFLYPLGNSGISLILFTKLNFVLSISTIKIPSLKVKSLESKKSSV